MTIKKLYEKYQGQTLEDWGAVCSEDFKRFASDFRSVLKTIAKETGAELVKFKRGHYDFYGFFQRDDQYVYFSFSAPRGMPIDLNQSDPLNGILYRTAASETDYKGGSNHFTNINWLGTHLAATFMSKAA